MAVPSPLAPRDRYFEDWRIGEVFEGSETVLMEEERMIEFGHEFDPQPFHVDPKAASESFYGGLIASGWHTGSVMMRLITEFVGPSSMGAPGVDELRWRLPVRPGDLLRLRLTVLELTASRSKPDRGFVRARQELLNQDDQVVMSLVSPLMIQTRSSG